MEDIFDGDSLSLLLFMLTAYLLTFFLRNLKDYQYETESNNNVTHNFFVGDFKLYANNINTTKQLLDLIVKFSKDTGMTFGEEYAYQQIGKGKLINDTKELQINDLKIKPIQEGNSHKYLDIDEDISSAGLVNKTRVTKGYYTRAKSIWFHSYLLLIKK